MRLPQYPDCTYCELHEYAKSVCIPTVHLEESLKFPAKNVIVFVGQNPGYFEDQKNEPFIAKSGTLVRKAYVGGCKLNEYASIFLTNGVRCHTEANETPKPRHYVACNNYLLQDLTELSKSSDKLIVVTLGAPATASMYKNILGLKRMSLSEAFNLNGNEHEVAESFKVIVFSTYHPAAVLRNRNHINTISSHMQLVHDCLLGTMAVPSVRTRIF